MKCQGLVNICLIALSAAICVSCATPTPPRKFIDVDAFPLHKLPCTAESKPYSVDDYFCVVGPGNPIAP